MCYYTQKQPLRGGLECVLKFVFKVPSRCLQVGLFLVGLQATSLQPYWKRTFSWVFFNDFGFSDFEHL